MIPISQAPISGNDILQTLYADVITKTNGFRVLEDSLSEYLNCKNIILTSSGSVALYNLLRAYNLKKEDEIIMPAYFCENIPRLVHSMGLKVKFADIEPHTYNIDPNNLNEIITKNTKVVIAVHMFGYPCQISDIVEISHDSGALVIEDCAQAMGAKYDNLNVGTIGDSGFFSMGMGKPLTTINGGIIISSDKNIINTVNKYTSEFKKCNLIDNIKLFSYMLGYNIANSRHLYSLIHKLRKTNSKVGFVGIQELMYSYTNLQSILGTHQLSKLDSFNKIRIVNANYLMDKLVDDTLHFPQYPNNSNPIFLRLPVSIENVKPNEINNLIKIFEHAGIEVSKYMDVSLPQLFNKKSNECPISETITKKTLTLPTHPNVTKKDLDKIIQIMTEWRSPL